MEPLQIPVEMCDICLGKRLEKTTGSVSLDARGFVMMLLLLAPNFSLPFPQFMPDGSKKMSTHISLEQNFLLLSMKICEDGTQSPVNVLDQMMVSNGDANIFLIADITHLNLLFPKDGTSWK